MPINLLKPMYNDFYYEKRAYDFELRYPYLGTIARILVNRYKPQKTLDVGCAKGYLVFGFRKCGVDAYGVDLSSYAIKECPKEISDYLSQCDVESDKLPFGDNQFDMVTSMECMEHIKCHDNIISEMKRVIKPNGLVVFSSPKITLWRKLFNSIFGQSVVHPSEFTTHKWIELFNKQGFIYEGDFLLAEPKAIRKYLWEANYKLTEALFPTLGIGKIMKNIGLNKLRTYMNMLAWEGERYVFRKRNFNKVKNDD